MITKVNIHSENYLFNYNKGLVIRQLRSISIVNLLNIPLYEDCKVHFSDVLKQLIKNAFDSIGEEYLPSESIKGKIERKWKRAWKKTISCKMKILDTVDLYMAGMLICDKHKIIKNNRMDRYVFDNRLF